MAKHNAIFDSGAQTAGACVDSSASLTNVSAKVELLNTHGRPLMRSGQHSEDRSFELIKRSSLGSTAAISIRLDQC